jgi:hypothetical protein
MRGCPLRTGERDGGRLRRLRWRRSRRGRGERDSFALGGADDLLVEGREGGARMAGGGETVGVWEADRVRVAEACGLDSDHFARLMDGDAEGGDRLARSSQPLLVGGGSDEDFRQVDGADQPSCVRGLPGGEERAYLRVLRVGAVKGGDQDVGVEDELQRCSSSASSCSR